MPSRWEGGTGGGHRSGVDRPGRQAAEDDGGPRVALELSQVAFCDSSGLNAFLRLWKRAKVVGGELVLVDPGPRLAELLIRTGVDAHVRVVDALSALVGVDPQAGPAAPEPEPA
ncbi:STAS domain-containing protein [Actinomadura yumaensis]|uniref:STAS domain-containing protein n=1 Tax=Actinomadura yumaensis TaxID=111807 RepID=A0ABW2CFW1_9ACTN